jgi:hypothetical protein
MSNVTRKDITDIWEAISDLTSTLELITGLRKNIHTSIANYAAELLRKGRKGMEDEKPKPSSGATDRNDTPLMIGDDVYIPGSACCETIIDIPNCTQTRSNPTIRLLVTKSMDDIVRNRCSKDVVLWHRPRESRDEPTST